MAALFVTGLLYFVGNPNGESQTVYAKTTGVAVGIGMAGLHTFSMAVGIDRVGRCRELLDARARARQAAEEEEEDEDEDEDVEPAKAAGQATPASHPTPEVVPTVAPATAPAE